MVLDTSRAELFTCLVSQSTSDWSELPTAPTVDGSEEVRQLVQPQKNPIKTHKWAIFHSGRPNIVHKGECVLQKKNMATPLRQKAEGLVQIMSFAAEAGSL